MDDRGAIDSAESDLSRSDWTFLSVKMVPRSVVAQMLMTLPRRWWLRVEKSQRAGSGDCEAARAIGAGKRGKISGTAAADGRLGMRGAASGGAYRGRGWQWRHSAWGPTLSAVSFFTLRILLYVASFTWDFVS